MFRTIALTGFAALVAASTISLAPTARAQIGNIFSDPPLPAPGAIPRGNQPPPPEDEEEVPELPRGRLLPTPNRPPPGQAAPGPGTFQSQPLAPPRPGRALSTAPRRPPPPGPTVFPQNPRRGLGAHPPQRGGPTGPAVAN